MQKKKQKIIKNDSISHEFGAEYKFYALPFIRNVE